MKRTTVMAILAATAALTAYDLWADYGEGARLLHLATEGLVLALSATGLARLLVKHRSAHQAVGRLSRELDDARRDLESWREEARAYLAGLGAAIDRQFERWELTPAEKEVALLMLKGLSFKEIAGIRGSSERTVRQQSQSVYDKAGISGRAELSAFFLEDLLLPHTSSPEDPR